MKSSSQSAGLRTALCFAFLGGALGCGENGSTAGMTVRDSVGIRIVDNGPVDGPTGALRLSDQPLFRIGWREDEHAFGRISGGALLPDGRAVVVDQMENRAIVFSADGGILDRVGASGAGPGEFGAMHRVAAFGADSLVIQDGYRGFSLFHRGEFVREVGIRDFQLTMLGRDGGHRVFFGPPTMVEPFPDGSPDRWIPLEVPVVDIRSGSAETFVEIDYALRTSGDIFAPQTLVAVAGGRLVIARQDVPEVRWLDAEGRVAQVARWAATPESPGDSLWAAIADGFHARWDAVMGEAESSARIAEDRARSTGPVPLFGGMVGDARGGIWLAAYTPYWGDPPGRYHVISPEGEWLGAVEMPERFELLDVRDGRALGVQKDRLDVEAAAVYDVLSLRP